METITDKLNYLNNTKIAIRDAINSKGGTLTEEDSFRSYVAAIGNITTGGGESAGVIEPITITENGIYVAKNGVDGYSPITVDVEVSVGDMTEDELTLKGECNYRFYGGGWDWFINKYGSNIKCDESGIRDAGYMFSGSGLTTIPFNLIGDKTEDNCPFTNMFYGCDNLEQVPYIINGRPYSMASMFTLCRSLKEIPEDYFDTWDFSVINPNRSGSQSQLFYNCNSLRKVPAKVLSYLWRDEKNAKSYSNAFPYCTFQNCYALDEIIGFPVGNCLDVSQVSNKTFTKTFDKCSRLKEFTFEMNEDGTPKEVPYWSGAIIDLTSNVGYAATKTNITSYSGIPTTKQVTDDASYQALKDDPDWWTLDVNYSRYNRTSAVNTINSLPDICNGIGNSDGSELGTKATIKFTGNSGALTDGGAINTLTEEEIAVAIAKHWAVAFV